MLHPPSLRETAAGGDWPFLPGPPSSEGREGASLLVRRVLITSPGSLSLGEYLVLHAPCVSSGDKDGTVAGAYGGTLGAVSAVWSTITCKLPVPNLRLTLGSFRAVRGDCGDSCSVNTVSCRAPLIPVSLSLVLGYRDKTSLSATELPSSSKNSLGSGEEGERPVYSTVQ